MRKLMLLFAFVVVLAVCSMTSATRGQVNLVHVFGVLGAVVAALAVIHMALYVRFVGAIERQYLEDRQRHADRDKPKSGSQ